MSSLNLSEFVKNPYTNNAYFDYEDFKYAVRCGISALDKLIDENYRRHPLKQQQELSCNYRNIGLGAFGYATMLMKMGLKYGSESAIRFTDDIFKTMFRESVFWDTELADKYGAYPKFNSCVWESDIIKDNFSQDEIASLKQKKLRNCSLISIAPNGSLATLLNESGGCEPEFAIKYTRRTVGMTDGEDTYYDVYCKAAREYREIHPDEKQLPDYFISSSEIPYASRVETQGVMQSHVDTAISSTVNMPNSATRDDIAQMYLLAWKSGCKGITMFRDGCKKLGILTTNSTQKQDEEVNHESDTELKRGEWKPLADDTVYYKKKLRIGCGDLKLFIGWSSKEHSVQDIYVKKSGSGGCERLEESTAIAMSAVFRLGGNVANLEKAFRGIGTCPSFTSAQCKGRKLSKGNSCGSVILNAIKDFAAEMDKKAENKEIAEVILVHAEEKHETNAEKCPECGSVLVFEGGCVVCKDCGWSKCN